MVFNTQWRKVEKNIEEWEVGAFMEIYKSLLKNSLFDGLSEDEIGRLYKCIAARERTAERESFVFHAGDEVRFVYLILSGSMHIISEDFWGNRTIVETMQAHTLFGEAYVLYGAKEQLVGVIAAEDAVYLEIDPSRLFEKCSSACACHDRLIRNTMRILSAKIIRLTEKLEHIAHRSMREKILSYLSKCAQKAQSNAFDIPYSRQQLADYLCVDRSALSHELSRLADLGMIRYRKNHFELLDI